MLEVRVLGPLEIRANGAPMPLGGPKQQTLLAMLALHAGRMVSLDELVDELWPSRPPASAVANTRMYAANLRRLFDSNALTSGLVAREGTGYLLRGDLAQVDRLAFEADCQRARQARAAGDAREAASILAAADARWRGPMLAGIPRGPVLTARCGALEEERLAIVEERADLCLAAGQPEEAVRLLRDHVRLHPLREQAHVLLMRALSEIGDTAAALEVYRDARTVLVEQLGIEPGKELRRLHQTVLTSDSPPDAAARCWLPRGIADFTGRAALLATTLRATQESDGGPIIKLIDGMAGSGKTTLAVHVAHRLAGSYPDAQLFVDLQGHGDNSPHEPATALAVLLRQLGVAAGRIPGDLEGRVALWRAELAKRRAVVVLDNVAGSDQVSALLPTSPGCVVLLTSRRRLVALDGGHPVSLPVLPSDEAIELFAKIVGRSRIDGEPEAAEEVVRRCGYLPLAIRLAGARLAHRPSWRVADLAGRLRDESQMLPELAVENRSIARAFALSYHPLPESSKRMFRLLGLWPGEHFEVVTAAALSGAPLHAAESTIGDLVDRHLVDESAVGRYRLHDLMREYARGIAQSVDPPDERRAAIGRVLDHYMHAAAAATEPFEVPELRQHLIVEPPLRPELLDVRAETGLAWLEEEQSNIKALVRQAAETGHAGYAWRLARATWRFCYMYGYLDNIISSHQYGLSAAKTLNDSFAVATMHNYLASGLHRTGRYREAIDHLDSATTLYRQVGAVVSVVQSQANLGVVYSELGRLDEAVTIMGRAVEESRRSKGPALLHVLSKLGLALTYLGRYREALAVHRRHLLYSLNLKDDFQISQALAHIGSVRRRMGDHARAIRFIRASLALKRRTGKRFAEGEALNELGVAYRCLREFDDAKRCHRAALKIVEASGERHIESAVYNDLALTLAAQGNRRAVVDLHQRALSLATKIGHPYEQARALAGIAACVESDDPGGARHHWQRALALYRKMNVPEQYEVERRLRPVSDPTI